MNTLNSSLQDLYQTAILFAAAKHEHIGQKVPGTQVTYVVHLSNVAMEVLVAAGNTLGFDVSLAVQAALLHDTMEDTQTTYDEIAATFGPRVADAVAALTKDPALGKQEGMRDSLDRIIQQPKEVWAVKLADRITNLQRPPSYWAREKIAAYREEGELILSRLQGANASLEKRLRIKLNAYGQYLETGP